MKQIAATVLVILGITFYLGSKDYTVNEVSESMSEIDLGENKVLSDNILLPFVKEFYDEAIDNGLDVDKLSKGYTGIHVERLAPGFLGKTFFYPDLGFSVLTPEVLVNDRQIRVLVFHELGHWYGFRHCHDYCISIMSANAGRLVFYNNWEAQKEIMFKQLDHRGINIE